MSTLAEKIDSRQWTTGNKSSVTMHYILDGTSDDLTAKALLLSSTSTSYDGLVRDDCTLEPIFVDTITDQGKWECTVRYVAPEYQPPQVGKSTFNFDTGGGTQHITQSIQTINSYAESGTPPDFKGAIGVTSSGGGGVDNVEGVDITIPVYNFSQTHYIDDNDVNKSAYFSLTGKVNNSAWNGFNAGEVLFLGASGSKRDISGSNDDWEITFRFAASPNRSNIIIGNITGISKKGWEYMWVRYTDTDDAVAKAIVKIPVAVYIEKVYEEGDFSALGIGG